MTTMGTIPEDCGALDLQQLVLSEPEVTESMTRLTAELEETYMAMQDIAEHGMGMLSDGTVLTTAEIPATTATMSSIEHEEIFAAGKQAFRELEQVTVQLDDAAAVAEAYESVFTGETENVLTMSHWDAPSIARQAQAAGVLDEFSEQLRVIEPIEVYDPAPPPQLVADFAAVDLEAEVVVDLLVEDVG